jgi:hypothetical protein
MIDKIDRCGMCCDEFDERRVVPILAAAAPSP